MPSDKTGKLIREGCRRLQQGNAGSAIKAFRQAVRNNSRSIEGWLQLGQLYMRLGDFPEAANCFQHIISIDQNHLIAHGNLGICHHRLQKLDAAISGFRKTLQLQPDNITALRHLATALLDKGERQQAATLCEQAIRLQPDFSGAYMLRGAIHNALGEFELAAENYRKAQKLEPGIPNAIAGEANALIKLSKKKQACTLISPYTRTAIDNASLAIAYAATYEIHGNPERAAEQIETILSNPSLAHGERLQLHFSAGELYDRTGLFDKAFQHYKMGNRYVARQYSPGTDRLRLDRTKTAFDTDTLDRLPVTEQGAITPVFIVGMPRSGTSLVERILSRHSQVGAGGELPCIPEISASLLDSRGNNVRYPENIADTAIDSLRRHAAQHLQRLELIAKYRPVVTDKLPHNFLFLGLIQTLFPGARIIHCRRYVLDTCISNYFQYFAGGLDYAYSLEDIAHHYNHYSELMAHWRQTLKLDMLEVDYEMLVARQEETTRKLVDFCGLQWEPDCLDFHKSAEITRTASYAQVRQPMYSHSVGRWRNYEKHLQPLIRQLTPSLLDTS